MKKYVFYFFAFCMMTSYAQDMAKIDSLSKIDFLSKTYTYLDKEFNIKISSDDFEKAVKKYGFYKDKINDHVDSLNVVLKHELKDSDAARIATLQISYTWERLSFYLWESEDTLKAMAAKEGIFYPYKFKKYVQKEEPKQLLETLRDKVYKQTEDKIVLNKNTKDLLRYAFQHSPARRAKVNQIHIENGQPGLREDKHD